jgi:hypothetical protein
MVHTPFLPEFFSEFGVSVNSVAPSAFGFYDRSAALIHGLSWDIGLCAFKERKSISHSSGEIGNQRLDFFWTRGLVAVKAS